MIPEDAAHLTEAEIAQLQLQRAIRGPHVFTSAFGVQDVLLASQCGYKPLGQVMGAVKYSCGQCGIPSPGGLDLATYDGGELEFLSRVRAQTRSKAFQRMQTRARLLGANGVVGITYRSQAPAIRVSENWASQGPITFLAFGTAVSNGTRPTPTPFLTNLSGAELWQLQTAGYEPCGLVAGNCVYYQWAAIDTRRALQPFNPTTLSSLHSLDPRRQNFEIGEYTASIYTARKLAMRRLSEAAEAIHAHGVVGTTMHLTDINFHESNRGLVLVFSLLVLGTAIRQVRDGNISPIPVVSLQ